MHHNWDRAGERRLKGGSILRTLLRGLPELLDCPSAERWHLGETQCHHLHGTKTLCSLVKSWAVRCFESSFFAPSCSKTCLECAAGLVLLRCRQTHSIWNSSAQIMTSTRQVSRFDLLCGALEKRDPPKAFMSQYDHLTIQIPVWHGHDFVLPRVRASK